MTKWGEKDLSSWDKFYALKIRQWKVVDRLIRESRRFGTSGATHGVFGTEIFLASSFLVDRQTFSLRVIRPIIFPSPPRPRRK